MTLPVHWSRSIVFEPENERDVLQVTITPHITRQHSRQTLQTRHRDDGNWNSFHEIVSHINIYFVSQHQKSLAGQQHSKTETSKTIWKCQLKDSGYKNVENVQDHNLGLGRTTVSWRESVFTSNFIKSQCTQWDVINDLISKNKCFHEIFILYLLHQQSDRVMMMKSI